MCGIRILIRQAALAALLLATSPLLAQEVQLGFSPELKPAFFEGAFRFRLEKPEGNQSFKVPLQVTAVSKLDDKNLTSLIISCVDHSPFSPLTITISNVTNDPTTVTQDILIPGEFANRPLTIQAMVSYNNGTITRTDTLTIRIDVDPPRPQTPTVERYPGGSATVRIPMADSDLDVSSLLGTSVVVNQLTSGDTVPVKEPSTTATVAMQVPLAKMPFYDSSSHTVVLQFNNLNPGPHSLTIKKLKDLFGTEMSVPLELPLNVPGGKQTAEQVEYPRFLAPEGLSSQFDPGDRVDTAVVQLYYFRDAMRVAELINRNVKNLNQTAYDEAQRYAQEGRENAANRIDERRAKEALAVQEAQATRAMQHQLDRAREDLQAALRAQNELLVEERQLKTATDQLRKEGQADLPVEALIAAANSEINTLDGQIAKSADDNPDLKKLQNARQDAVARRTSLRVIQSRLQINTNQKGEIDAQAKLLQDQLSKLPGEIANQQQIEISSRNEVLTAEALELHAAEERFRRELAAGLADPDTYAKGKKESIDPVAQVTISVVGVSRLQLRGPIKGVNKIRRMIHQIDSPVGQVKVGIHTVQVNGEHGDRMDFVYERIHQEIAHSRFLVNQSVQLLQRAVAEVAAEVALSVDQGTMPMECPPGLAMGTDQTSRDWRYLYAFFGADFINELVAMDSELLNSENKMLSLHSMDSISLAGALSITALADYPIRARILDRFQEYIIMDLPEREVEYVQALTHVTKKGKLLDNKFWRAIHSDSKRAEEIYFNAERTYHFPNTLTFFTQSVLGQGTLNPVQYATIKMSQALKAQLVAEMEYQNLAVERSLLEVTLTDNVDEYLASQLKAQTAVYEIAQPLEIAKREAALALANAFQCIDAAIVRKNEESNAALRRSAATLDEIRSRINSATVFSVMYDVGMKYVAAEPGVFNSNVAQAMLQAAELKSDQLVDGVLSDAVDNVLTSLSDPNAPLYNKMSGFQASLRRLLPLQQNLEAANADLDQARKDLLSKRLLDQFMDEKEEQSVALMEALREHTSNVDNYLKRLAIALEDDIAAQFYEPAFQRIRRVSRTYDVTLGQIESTTILTNNRTLAKVDPSATFEFDLPHRDILLTEAMKGSKALATEYGNLLNDGTFLAGTAMIAGQPPAGIIGDNAAVEAIPGLALERQFGSELQKLIPDPSIYKFETGTGFEIRPVIQPDGHSIMYTFDYMYSTNVREPVRADEKHLGRIKRHFVHTDVQTSSYELREISRYTVALKVARTERGVPLFEDIPAVGVLFRPLPSAESSLQTNIILGSSTIYPTMFDLMGLRWSPYVDDLSSKGLMHQKLEQKDRQKELRDQLLRTTRRTVNEQIGLPLSKEPPVIYLQAPNGGSQPR